MLLITTTGAKVWHIIVGKLKNVIGTMNFKSLIFLKFQFEHSLHSTNCR